MLLNACGTRYQLQRPSRTHGDILSSLPRVQSCFRYAVPHQLILLVVGALQPVQQQALQASHGVLALKLLRG